MRLVLVTAAVGLWFWLGDPPKNVADWFYRDDAAPWETVDAYYYPSRADLSASRSILGLKDVQACRDWVYDQAAANHDALLTRGDYECGVGRLDAFMGVNVYRLTIQ